MAASRAAATLAAAVVALLASATAPAAAATRAPVIVDRPAKLTSEPAATFVFVHDDPRAHDPLPRRPRAAAALHEPVPHGRARRRSPPLRGLCRRAFRRGAVGRGHHAAAARRRSRARRAPTRRRRPSRSPGGASAAASTAPRPSRAPERSSTRTSHPETTPWPSPRATERATPAARARVDGLARAHRRDRAGRAAHDVRARRRQRLPRHGLPLRVRPDGGLRVPHPRADGHRRRRDGHADRASAPNRPTTTGSWRASAAGVPRAPRGAPTPH